MQKIKKSFPSLEAEFYDILCDRLKENEVTDNELTEAVNHVIDTCIYPTPTIAQFITYIQDKRDSIPTFHFINTDDIK